MLDLFEIINIKARHINEGLITACNDNQKLMGVIKAESIAKNSLAQEGGAEIARIRQIIKESPLQFEL